MTITFYTVLDEDNRINKSLGSPVASLTGTLKTETSMIDPVIMLEASETVFASVNYMYIPDFKRYYFIRNVKSIRTGLVEVAGHVDVLYTYKDEIR